MDEFCSNLGLGLECFAPACCNAMAERRTYVCAKDMKNVSKPLKYTMMKAEVFKLPSICMDCAVELSQHTDSHFCSDRHKHGN